MKSRITERISDKLDELFNISKYLYENPELGEQEYQAARLLTDYLTKNGFTVEHPVYDIPTAFRASYASRKEGPNIALFCEYDALPEIGHGCGHNLISTMSIGAALGLKAILDETGGRITVFGTPAEETSGVKGILADQGAYQDVTVAMMAHPSPVSETSGTSLALQAIKFEYFGKTAHAAAMPEKGINALDSVILLYNGINALRQHVTSDVRMHGIISHGGVAPNIVPDYAETRFYFRAQEKKNLEKVIEKVKKCAEGAASMTGATVKISNFENSYDNLRTNTTLSEIFNANLMSLGEKEIRAASNGIGSIDMGNVSQVVPTIHPWIGIGDPELILHSKEFADYTITDNGKATIYKGPVPWQ
ncbi:M20 family metallopeptidase [Aminipila terrae]|uniref:M20 family metallopeptidase n=1 Tax=Aminipila terrae TaxID=2697030 RepID=UPI001FABBB01|nr:M20 family metallopeptidase [Aminipila terrae]